MNPAPPLQWTIARINDLSPAMLFRLLRLRVDVFVVEQRCIYPELDEADETAWHVIASDTDQNVVAGARIITGDGSDLPHVGRFCVRNDRRGQGLGHELVRQCHAWLRQHQGNVRSALAAQAHISSFYVAHGYRIISAPYDWDGIPHVDMVRDD
ncbi:MAG: GNAT family N-acetyltransferase [Flavobacteriales bacterium]|nr:GNAT family N-acetyltransferase [Flavobacteriales bacterium]